MKFMESKDMKLIKNTTKEDHIVKAIVRFKIIYTQNEYLAYAEVAKKKRDFFMDIYVGRLSNLRGQFLLFKCETEAEKMKVFSMLNQYFNGESLEGVEVLDYQEIERISIVSSNMYDKKMDQYPNFFPLPKKEEEETSTIVLPNFLLKKNNEQEIVEEILFDDVNENGVLGQNLDVSTIDSMVSVNRGPTEPAMPSMEVPVQALMPKMEVPAQPSKVEPQEQPLSVNPAPAEPSKVESQVQLLSVNPAPAEPSKVEPQVQPLSVNPVPAQPSKVEPQVQSVPVNPAPTKPAKVEPQVQSVSVNPAPTKPAKVESQVQSVSVNPVPAQPAKVEPQVQSVPVNPAPTKPAKVEPTVKPRNAQTVNVAPSMHSNEGEFNQRLSTKNIAILIFSMIIIVVLAIVIYMVFFKSNLNEKVDEQPVGPTLGNVVCTREDEYGEDVGTQKTNISFEYKSETKEIVTERRSKLNVMSNFESYIKFKETVENESGVTENTDGLKISHTFDDNSYTYYYLEERIYDKATEFEKDDTWFSNSEEAKGYYMNLGYTCIDKK